MIDDGGLSPEARRFLDSCEPDTSPTEFANMGEVRATVASGYQAAADRAVERHQLTIDTYDVAGVECVRFTSRCPTVAARPHAVLIYLFGGAFMVGDPISDLPIIGALAQWTAMTVVAPRYRLAPEHPAPAALDDTLAVYEALADQTSGTLVLAGESAGGNLALLTAQKARDAALRRPSAMALLSPAVDLRPGRDLFEPNVDRDPTLDASRMDEVLVAYVGDSDPADPSLSPILGEMKGLAPTIITTGTRDLFLSPCVRLATKMRRAGVEVDCRVWDGMWHVFEFYDDYPEQDESLAEIADHINVYTSWPPQPPLSVSQG
ncbi:MAG: alpha/beta hydrolase [Actinomycetia bacterium]|nr:alpha/beta hydrolase [Actinomycetes bacterium]